MLFCDSQYVHSYTFLQAFVMYVSNARGEKEQGKPDAYDRQFVKLNMKELFQIPRPMV